MGLADEWRKIRSKPANKELGNGKYKPDLGPIVAKYDADLKLSRTLDDQRKACLAELRDAIAKITAAKAALDPIFDARDKAVDDINKGGTVDFNKAVSAAGDDPVAMAKAFTDYAPLYARYSTTRGDADAKIDKGIKGIEKLIHDTAAKGKKTSDDIESKRKKVDAELDKLYDDIPAVIAGYIKLAQGSKNLSLEADLKGLMRQVPVKA